MKKILFTGHVGRCRLEDLPEDMTPVAELSLCRYATDCKKECSGDTSCRIKNFYERYPDYKSLGIGASTEVQR
jgi:hypothetical protein